MEMPVPFSPFRQVVAYVLAVLYATAYGGLVFLALKLLRMRCEGFGCTGIGIAWIALIAVYVVVVIVGFIARGMHTGAVRLALGYGLLSQVVAGLALFAYWSMRAAS